ncbi:hypothetical protein J7M00_03485 [bacterium]|nr:hypothetical protein [bacterium]
MNDNDMNEKLWRKPPSRGGGRTSGLDPTIIGTIKRLHERGRTVEEISLGLDLDEEEVELALARVMPKKTEDKR